MFFVFSIFRHVELFAVRFLNDLAHNSPAGLLLRALAVFPKGSDHFPDVSVYLFARPYPVPRFADGTLVFSLYPPSSYDRREGVGAEPIVEWRFDPGRMRAARFQNVVGQGYALALDLDEFGITSLQYNSADLVTAFEPAEGDRVVYGNSVQSIAY